MAIPGWPAWQELRSQWILSTPAVGDVKPVSTSPTASGAAPRETRPRRPADTSFPLDRFVGRWRRRRLPVSADDQTTGDDRRTWGGGRSPPCRQVVTMAGMGAMDELEVASHRRVS